MAILNIEDQISRQDRIRGAFEEVQDIVDEVIFTQSDEENNLSVVNVHPTKELDDETKKFIKEINEGNKNPLDLGGDSLDHDINSYFINYLNNKDKNKEK